MPIYMNYDSVPGDATADGHEKWIELNSFQWGVGRGISSPTGSSADRESSAPSVSEITVTKVTDITSTKILNEAYQGEGVKVVIDFCKTDKGSLEVYMQYTLDDVLVSGYSLSSGGEIGRASCRERVSKLEVEDIIITDKNENASPDTSTYDLALAKD